MFQLKSLLKSAYYKYAKLILHERVAQIPSHYLEKKNIFLYFDYEREFSGHNTSITTENIIEILDFLDNYNFKTTWFTIGKIFRKYPDSVKAIFNRGHEVGSHTYSHLTPLTTTKTKLLEDFKFFEQIRNDGIEVKGFHSPNGKWSLSLLSMLAFYNYSYDVLSHGRGTTIIPTIAKLDSTTSLFRLRTLGDDWLLFNSNASEKEVFNHFNNMLEELSYGDIAGIGFHPWILFSNNNILNGFKSFVESLSNRSDTNILRAIDYVNTIKTTNTQF